MTIRSTSPTEPAPEAYADRAEGWAFLRTLVECVVSMFGRPAELIQRSFIAASFRTELLRWLRPAEKLARILLLAEAADAADPTRRAAREKPARSAGPREGRSGSAGRAAVSFRVLAPQRRSGGRGARLGGTRPYNPAPLAARLEALLHVLDAPGRYAARLRRRLLARPDRRSVLDALLQPPKPAGAPLMRGVAQALPLAERARSAFDTG
jgi:hypothetical protein